MCGGGGEMSIKLNSAIKHIKKFYLFYLKEKMSGYQSTVLETIHVKFSDF